MKLVGANFRAIFMAKTMIVFGPYLNEREKVNMYQAIYLTAMMENIASEIDYWQKKTGKVSEEKKDVASKYNVEYFR